MTTYSLEARNTRPISWLKAARRDFEAFPQGAQTQILRAPTVAVEGRKADIAKPMLGFSSGVFEVALKHRSDACRTVYAVQLAEAIWVLHAFQKKSKQGIKTPQKELEVIRERLNRLREELSK